MRMLKIQAKFQDNSIQRFRMQFLPQKEIYKYIRNNYLCRDQKTGLTETP